MKLIIAIVHDDDVKLLVEELTSQQYSVTKLASTGGFLKMGNTTIIIGTEKNKIDHAIEIIKQTCETRTKVINSPTPIVGNAGIVPGFPMEIKVGGATVFVVDVERFEKL